MSLAEGLFQDIRRSNARLPELSAEDLTLLLGFLDALVTKNRLKALGGGVS